MSRKEKLLQRLESHPKDLTFDELCRIFDYFGYALSEKGNGSRVMFSKGNRRFRMHKPHPDHLIKPYLIEEVIRFLSGEGTL